MLCDGEVVVTKLKETQKKAGEESENMLVKVFCVIMKGAKTRR